MIDDHKNFNLDSDIQPPDNTKMIIGVDHASGKDRSSTGVFAVLYDCHKCGLTRDTYLHEEIDTERDDTDQFRLCSKCNSEVKQTDKLEEVDYWELFAESLLGDDDEYNDSF